jgi:hypothetical protein
MAQIVLSGEELVCILYANGLIPAQVTGVEMNGVEMKIKVKTPWPVLKSIHIGVQFAGFEGGQVVLQLITNRFLDTFDWLVDRMLASLHLQDHGGRWEYPRLYVDVNKLLQRQVRGVEITGIGFAGDCFHITTAHSPGAAGPIEAAADGHAAPSSIASPPE